MPHRLVWTGWEDFIAAGPNDDASTPTPPRKTFLYQALFYNQNVDYNEMPLAAYNLIYNEYFRDEEQTPIAADFIPPATPPTYPTPIQGLPTVGLYANQKRNILTTVRDDRETGAEATAPVEGTAPNQTVAAEEILRAIAEQKLQMRRATYGTRYVDILRGYGINVNYQMLQRPEVVAVGRSTVNITDVVSTASGTDLGSLAGHGIDGLRLKIRRKQFPEHGTLYGLMCVRPIVMGNATADRFDRGGDIFQDYFDPGLTILPPVEQIQKHTFQSGSTSLVQGYIPWGEWYRKPPPNRLHPNLSIQAAQSLTTTQINNDLVRRGQSAVNSVAYDNLFSDTTYEHYQFTAVNGLRALRMIPKAMRSVTAGGM